MEQFVTLWVILVQAINFFIIFWVLKTFLFTPLLNHLEEEHRKKEEIDAIHSTLEKLKKDAQKEADKRVHDAKQEAEKIRNSVSQSAKEKEAQILSDAQNEVKKLKEKAQLDMKNSQKSLEESLKKKLVQVAVNINQKLFVQSQKNKEFIETQAKNFRL